MMKQKLALMRTFKRAWRLWAKALGEKQGDRREADKIKRQFNVKNRGRKVKKERDKERE